ncbi:ABC transporter ATP-binding protein [Streptomyces flavofungini]|uniref:ABC transporter ATP-binding protein n=1 Tax=Streptomyces flavofungini TaxID=68200 RepID=A0ABS0X1A8_9ACTN|nr:ABC transporter ATP-binding protein [Streptomyces flavofungini]MBJ3806869.1 ABC transporter ATP-binding protein [Streptomyces flavofungini]GHC60022.1 cobalamin/Fe3+-siderophore ABC transporter ATP-binding protein [Streptomyces flavofungini]
MTAPAPATTAAARLTASELTLAYEDRTVVHELDLAIPDGEVTVIVGPNACGKSTTLRALGRLLKPKGGSVLLDGEALAKLPTRRVAQQIGLLPQTPVAPEAITVGDLVARGRQPHQRWWQQWSDADETAVTEAMARTDVAELAERSVDELSGGQRQRVWIAMALAQETELLLLDEPTTYLDISHQVEVLDLVRQLNHDRGRTVVVVLHDLNQAARYADHLVAMKAGRLVARGTPAEVVTEELVREVFGLDCVVIPDPVTGSPLVVPGTPWQPSAPGKSAPPAGPSAPADSSAPTGPSAPADASAPADKKPPLDERPTS